MEFIRIDLKGQWLGTKHISRVANIETLEDGISCYRLDNKAEAIENLYKYWTEIACATNIEDYQNLQITIFEGEKLSKWGSDSEDLATCTKTLKELDAVDFMSKVFKAHDALEAYQEDWDDEEQLTEEEYKNVLENLI